MAETHTVQERVSAISYRSLDFNTPFKFYKSIFIKVKAYFRFVKIIAEKKNDLWYNV
jgi:hypothetical protein